LAALPLAGCTERMFFYPDQVDYGSPAAAGLQHEDVYFAAEDGSQLHGWWLPAIGPARATVLHLHGNAANVSNHLPLVSWLPAAGFNVLMLDYRGFGRSQGRPTLDGVVHDAHAALRWLRSRPQVDAARLVLFGQSLGGATALRLLARDQQGVRLAIIEAAFSGYREIARDAARSSLILMPLAPLAVLALPDEASDPLAALAQVQVPLLFIHGESDGVIPVAHSERLHAAARGPSEFMRLPGFDHLEPLQQRTVREKLIARMVLAVQ
jgi:uncharacterized protein